MFGLPLVTCALRMISLLTCYNFDTPAFYIIKGDKISALGVLDRIYESDFKSQQFVKLENSLKIGDASWGLKDMFTKLKYPMFIGMMLGIF